MARRRYIAFNAATAALTDTPAGVATGTSIKTMLQLKPTGPIAVLEFGYCFESVPTALVNVDLLTTGTVAATVTAFTSGDIAKYDDASAGASALSLGTSASGYSASAEGTITASRLLVGRKEWGQSFVQQFPLDREPGVITNDILRIRAKTSVSIPMLCWLVWEE